MRQYWVIVHWTSQATWCSESLRVTDDLLITGTSKSNAEVKSRPKNCSIKSHLPNGAPNFRFRWVEAPDYTYYYLRADCRGLRILRLPHHPTSMLNLSYSENVWFPMYRYHTAWRHCPRVWTLGMKSGWPDGVTGSFDVNGGRNTFNGFYIHSTYKFPLCALVWQITLFLKHG